MSIVPNLMSDDHAYKIWRFLCEYPKKDLRKKDGGTIFENEFASLIDKFQDYSIVARSTDKVETAKGVLYSPDVLVHVNTLEDTFIVFECKSGQNIDIDVAAAFSAKIHNLAFKNEMVIHRNGSAAPLRYACEGVYRILISMHEPTLDALGFCWGNGIPVFYPAELPVEIVPVKVVRHRLYLHQPIDEDQTKNKQYYLERIADIDDRMCSEARGDPRDYKDLINEMKVIINGVNTLINKRWVR